MKKQKGSDYYELKLGLQKIKNELDDLIWFARINYKNVRRKLKAVRKMINKIKI